MDGPRMEAFPHPLHCGFHARLGPFPGTEGRVLSVSSPRKAVGSTVRANAEARGAEVVRRPEPVWTAAALKALQSSGTGTGVVAVTENRGKDKLRFWGGGVFVVFP